MLRCDRCGHWGANLEGTRCNRFTPAATTHTQSDSGLWVITTTDSEYCPGTLRNTVPVEAVTRPAPGPKEARQRN